MSMSISMGNRDQLATTRIWAWMNFWHQQMRHRQHRLRYHRQPPPHRLRPLQQHRCQHQLPLSVLHQLQPLRHSHQNHLLHLLIFICRCCSGEGIHPAFLGATGRLQYHLSSFATHPPAHSKTTALHTSSVAQSLHRCRSRLNGCSVCKTTPYRAARCGCGDTAAAHHPAWLYWGKYTPVCRDSPTGQERLWRSPNSQA